MIYTLSWLLAGAQDVIENTPASEPKHIKAQQLIQKVAEVQDLAQELGI